MIRKHSVALYSVVYPVVAALTVAFCTETYAQGEGDIIDKVRKQWKESLPKARSGGSVSLPDLPESSRADDTHLGGDSIQVIRLVAHQDRTDLEASFKIEAPVMIDRDLLPPKNLQEKLGTEFVGKELSVALMDDVIKTILTAYRESDYPLVDAYFPEQNITTGKLQIVVREAVLGKVSVEGAKYSNTDYLIKQIRVAPGERINSRILEGDVDWINSNPSRRIDLIYERGDVEGTSDIILKTEDSSPMSSYLSFGNTGIEATGFYEWSAGVFLSNIAGSEHSMGYNYGGDYDFDNLQSHVLVYEIPLPWRHRIQFLGVYSSSKSNAASGEDTLDVEGESIQGTANYKIILPRIKGEMRQNLNLSADYKSTNTDILFGGESFFDSAAIVFQFRIGYDLTVPDKMGYTRFDISGVYSPGDLFDGNDDETFEGLRDGSTADYWYLTGEIERIFRLPEKWNIRFLGKGRYSQDRLTSTEQQLAGGYRSVRGFNENIARGDSGVLLSSELISPPFQVFQECLDTSSSANFLLFYDSAFLKSNEIMGFPEPTQSLQSVGIGIDFTFSEKYRLRTSYGWNISSSGIGEEVPKGKLHFGFTSSF